MLAIDNTYCRYIWRLIHSFSLFDLFYFYIISSVQFNFQLGKRMLQMIYTIHWVKCLKKSPGLGDL